MSWLPPGWLAWAQTRVGRDQLFDFRLPEATVVLFRAFLDKELGTPQYFQMRPTASSTQSGTVVNGRWRSRGALFSWLRTARDKRSVGEGSDA